MLMRLRERRAPFLSRLKNDSDNCRSVPSTGWFGSLCQRRTDKGQGTSVEPSIPRDTTPPVCKAKISFKTILALLSLGGFLFYFGCSGANYGNVKHSRDVTQAFETYHVYPEHRYYYLNQENNPYAVVALQNSYRISDPQWREFDPQTDKLEKIVGLVKDFSATYSNAYGSYLKDASGNQIGYWYSKLPIRSLKVDNEAKKVSIHTDSPWLNDDDRGFGSGVGIGIGVGSGGSGIGIRLGR